MDQQLLFLKSVMFNIVSYYLYAFYSLMFEIEIKWVMIKIKYLGFVQFDCLLFFDIETEGDAEW